MATVANSTKKKQSATSKERPTLTTPEFNEVLYRDALKSKHRTPWTPAWNLFRKLLFAWWLLAFFFLAASGMILNLLLYPSVLVDPNRYLMCWVTKQCCRLIILAMPLWSTKILGSPESMTIPKGAKVVVVCNHMSFLDFFVLLKEMPFMFKFVSMALVGKVPFMGQCMQLRGDVFVNFAENKQATDGFRCTNRQDTLAGARHWVHRKAPVLVFPEGWLARKGNLRYLKDGAFEIAMDTRCFILPVALAGTCIAWPADGVPDSGECFLKFGRMIDSRAYGLGLGPGKCRTGHAEFERLRDDTRAEMVRLRQELLEEVYTQKSHLD